MRWPSDADEGSTATYTVTHAGGTTEVELDQREGGGTWRPIGVFEMAPSSGHKIVLDDEAASGTSVDLVFDNTNPATTRVGTWNVSTNVTPYFGSNYEVTTVSTNSFTWSLDVPQAGSYKVYARWPAAAARTASAQYAVTHAGGTTNVVVDQRGTSNLWNYLGTFTLTPGASHEVELSATATPYDIAADAIRIVLDENAIGSDEFVLDAGATGTSSTGTWSTQTPSPTVPIIGPSYRLNTAGTGTYTWTPTFPSNGWYKVYIRNLGGSNRTSAAKYEVTHAGGTTDVIFDMRYDSYDWIEIGVYQFANGSGHKIKLSNTLGSGRMVGDGIRFVRVPSQVPEDIVVDNTDTEASSTGTWTSSTTAGTGIFRGTDHVYNDGGGTFTWEPAIATAGKYRVYAQWDANTDRPIAAKYTIYHADGSSTVTANQRLSDTEWIYLGSYDFEPSQSHRVVLSDPSPNRRLMADAVRFVWETNQQTVAADAVKLVPAPAADGYYVHADHLGSPQAMTDDAQQEVWRIDTRPFGEVEALTWTVENNQRFPGQYADAESGYSYNYFRDYEPALGRYLQSDPIGLAGGINTFAYVGGNPLVRVDVTGLDTLIVGGGGTATVAAGVDVSGGFAYDTNNGQIAAFAAYGPSVGANLSTDVFLGWLFVDICQVEGSAAVWTLTIPVISASIYLDSANTSDIIGFSVGFGPSIPGIPIMGSFALSTTSLFYSSRPQHLYEWDEYVP